MLARSLAALALALMLALAGCGGDDGGDGEGEPPKPPGAEDGGREVEIAEDPPAKAAKLTGDPQEGDFEGIDFEEYEQSLDEMVALIEDFWSREFDAAGESYEPPADVVAYYPGEPDAPACGGEPAPPENAFYCSDNDLVAWDEPTLFIPYYRDRGDAAVGMVLAHEWGHLVQERLGESTEFKHTIEAELQADCLAGAWFADLDEQELLDGNEPGQGGDIDEALDSVFSLGDPPDTGFEDPSAHGTGEERVQAFSDGFDGGLETCANDYAAGWSEEPGDTVEPNDAQGGDAIGFPEEEASDEPPPEEGGG